MIKAKVKMFNEDYPFSLEKEINEFLETIDVRQIIKTEYSSGMSLGQYEVIKKSFSAVIYYVELADVRDAKIDNVLEIK
jgi:hypothetical protein